jgi:hypothetical protein
MSPLIQKTLKTFAVSFYTVTTFIIMIPTYAGALLGTVLMDIVKLFLRSKNKPERVFK